MFHYTVKTAKSAVQAIADLQDHLKDEKFGVLWHLDLKEKLREKGVDYDQTYHILEVCNPVEAKRVLQESSLIGYFLPCKIVVYEEAGNTHIGLPKPTALVGMVDNPNLLAIAEEIEERLMGAINKSR
jgi:uncharacterized protein (DUF302 family)